MVGVAGLGALVAVANDIQAESHLLSLLDQVKMLSMLHQQNPVRSVQHFAIPIAELRDGQMIGVASTDILYDAESIKTQVNQFRARYPDRAVSLLLSGQLAPAAAEVFRNASIGVHSYR